MPRSACSTSLCRNEVPGGSGRKSRCDASRVRPALMRRLSGIRRSQAGSSPCLTVGALMAQLFSQFMSGTGLDFSVPASSIASPHRTIGIDRECRAPGGGGMTQRTLLGDCHNSEQRLTKAECERARKIKIHTKCENAKKMKHLSEEDPMVSKIWSRWIHGELQAPI